MRGIFGMDARTLNESLTLGIRIEINCQNSLVPRLFHLPTPEGAREERPWFRLVTCLTDKFSTLGGVLNQGLSSLPPSEVGR